MSESSARGAISTIVSMRWSDLDAYGHLNNARAVTLLEEARIALLWTPEARAAGVAFEGGLFVAGLTVDYRRQVGYRVGRGLRVDVAVDRVRAASFRILYDVHGGPEESDEVAVRASTTMAVFDRDAQRPRRLSEGERHWLIGLAPGSAP